MQGMHGAGQRLEVRDGTHTHTCVHVHRGTCVHTSACTHTHCTGVHVHTWHKLTQPCRGVEMLCTNKHVCTRDLRVHTTRTHTRTHTQEHTRMQTHTHAHTHTHTHAHTHSNASVRTWHDLEWVLGCGAAMAIACECAEALAPPPKGAGGGALHALLLLRHKCTHTIAQPVRSCAHVRARTHDAPATHHSHTPRT